MVSTARRVVSRRDALAEARQSRRPSRLGTLAGATAEPDKVLDDDAGFPGLLARAWRTASAAQTLASAVTTLLTLDGHVPADVQLRAVSITDESALRVLFGVSWREGPSVEPHDDAGERPAFIGELGLTTSGRVVLCVPSQVPLVDRENLIGNVLRVPWSSGALEAFRVDLDRATEHSARSAAECRAWLAAAGAAERDRVLEQLKEAALRTAPFLLYQDDRTYTNFRERNNLTGQTLWSGHPDCALSRLQRVPLQLWSDNDVTMVVCLTLLVRSASFARIEEANGTQLTVAHVAELLESARHTYDEVLGGDVIPPAETRPAETRRIESLNELAETLGRRRKDVTRFAQLYREIHGPLMHKIERVAGPPQHSCHRREEMMCSRLAEVLPLAGATFDELSMQLDESPAWLVEPSGAFGTGLESLVHETVSAATDTFEADFTMSRGIRSLPRLVGALRAEDWSEIVRWDLPDFFCCVVPTPEARQYFGDSPADLADIAWSMSARMQYNSWHFIAGNLPRVLEVVARDYFVPPSIPDLAYFSDQHHHGHVAAHVRFSIRSPQPVTVLDRSFAGFVDLRLLRCAGTPFDEQDLLAAHRASAFIANATGLVATLVADGAKAEVTAFDSRWHWNTIAGTRTSMHDGEEKLG